MPTPSKPDTAAIRGDIQSPIMLEELGLSQREAHKMVSTILRLCDYIDSQRVIVKQKVTVEQVREFAATKAMRVDVGNTVTRRGFSVYVNLREILDFIDNGPPKPTAEEIICDGMALPLSKFVRMNDAQVTVSRLREAGYLREDA